MNCLGDLIEPINAIDHGLKPPLIDSLAELIEPGPIGGALTATSF